MDISPTQRAHFPERAWHQIIYLKVRTPGRRALPSSASSRTRAACLDWEERLPPHEIMVPRWAFLFAVLRRSVILYF